MKALHAWLSSYKPGELVTEKGEPIDEILSIIPKDERRRLGQVEEWYAGREQFIIPDWKQLAVKSGGEESCMKIVGKYMDLAFQANPTGLRLFSPDELESNKLSAVFDNTSRNFQWDEYSFGKGGRVIEILSEHTCQGLLPSSTFSEIR
jgi:xylulose-5-phosphate/fructose-6-phosphate phosphoketolase